MAWNSVSEPDCTIPYAKGLYTIYSSRFMCEGKKEKRKKERKKKKERRKERKKKKKMTNQNFHIPFSQL